MTEPKFKLKSPHSHDACKGHGHSHVHTKINSDSAQQAFIVGIVLNLGFTLIEFFYGLLSNSVALVADAGHNLSDVLGLVIGLIAAMLLKRKANKKFTYGLKGSTIISALLNSVILLITVGAILWESFSRLNSAHEVQTTTMMVIAAIGIVINFSTAMFFKTHGEHDLNARGAFLHLMGDAAVSLGVVIAALVIRYTGNSIIDPIVSIIISFIIIYNTWGLFKESLYLSINAVPENIDIDKVSSFLRSLSGVDEIHDLHIWAMSTTETALTVHLIMPTGSHGDLFLKEIENSLKEKFNIHHSTIQIENHTDEIHGQENCFQV